MLTNRALDVISAREFGRGELLAFADLIDDANGKISPRLHSFTVWAFHRLAQLEREVGKCGTPFPWNKVPVRVVHYIRRDLSDKYRCIPDNYSWPLSCEDFVEIGPEIIGEIKKIGKRSVDAIGEALKELGFRFA